MQGYAVLAESAEEALTKLEARQPGVPAAFLAVHEEVYGVALGRRSDLTDDDVDQVRETAAALRDPLSWRTRKKLGTEASASHALLAPDGNRIGDRQLHLLRLLRDKGPWYRGGSWNAYGAYETDKLARALLERGLVCEAGHATAKVRRRSLPADLAPPTEVPVFEISALGREMLEALREHTP